MTEITKKREKGLYLTGMLFAVALSLLLSLKVNAAVVFTQPPSGAFLRQSSQIGYDPWTRSSEP